MTHSSEMRVPPQKLLPSMVTATCLYLFWSNVIISSPNLNNEMQFYQACRIGIWWIGLTNVPCRNMQDWIKNMH
jgi:hypothetical protein